MSPSILYKAFTCREYAELFSKGRIRFSTLEYYKNIEDLDRADITEGIGAVKRDGEKILADIDNKLFHADQGIEELYVRANVRERFICCFSYSDDGNYIDLPNKFGQFYVKVNSPENLFRDLEVAM